ncbi:MAG: methyltransferase domain-containing protein [Candidatus Omnitrophica bacterium]|nr:methyltransferase domain-containing protein [Candidatus Omnitrophota bacterium]
MFAPNVKKVLDEIREGDIVLDIGGWALPFNRANYVIDMMPYETRGTWPLSYAHGPQGGGKEYFDKTTWIQRDICDRTPFPFKDKSIDYVICSHTLEDLRDPIWVCSEINRVGKRGYIEFPSRLVESSSGVEPRIIGYSHHRWLINIDKEKNKIIFLLKYHMIHSTPKFYFPGWFVHHLPEELRVQWLFWQDYFEYEEKIIHGLPAIESELERFILKNEKLLSKIQANLKIHDWIRYFFLCGKDAFRYAKDMFR